MAILKEKYLPTIAPRNHHEVISVHSGEKKAALDAGKLREGDTPSFRKSLGREGNGRISSGIP